MKKSHNIVRRWRRPGLALFLLSGSAYAGEYAVLTNGFRLHADRHETSGDRVTLYANGGVSEVLASQVASFETEEIAPVVSPQPKAAEPAVPSLTVKPKTGDLFSRTAEKHKIPEALVRSIVRAESNGNAKAISPKGAIGLMQLMPATALQLGADPTVPEQNVDAGTRYLKELLAKYEDKDDQVARAVAAYNAGPGAVDKYKGIPPYRETQTYVRRVLTDYLKSQQ